MAGPFCGQVLGDMGADVIKVEPPGTGDQTRVGMGEHAFRAVNRNKRSITLDLKDPGDVATLHRLVATADVLTENFRPGVAARLERRLRDAARAQPAADLRVDLGLRADRPVRACGPGFDLIAQGAAGVMSVTGEPGGNPVKAGVPVSDLSAGLFCAIGILSALHSRADAPGRGSGSTRRCGRARSRSRSGRRPSCGRPAVAPQPLGSAHRLTAPYQALRTQGRPRHRRRQQPEAVAAAVRRDRARGPAGATRASRPTPTAWPTGPSWSRELEAATDARDHRALGRRAARGRRPRGPDPRLRPGRRGPPHPRT